MLSRYNAHDATGPRNLFLHHPPTLPDINAPLGWDRASSASNAASRYDDFPPDSSAHDAAAMTGWPAVCLAPRDCTIAIRHPTRSNGHEPMRGEWHFHPLRG